MILQPVLCFYSFFSQTTSVRLCNKVWRFSRICSAQPHFADEMLRLVLGLRYPRPSPKRGTRTGFYHYCQRIRFGPTVKPLRSHPSTVSRRVGRLATHQNLVAFRIDSVHGWLAQKERKPPANVPLFWPMAQTRFLETVPSSSKQTCRAVPTSGLPVICPLPRNELRR